MWNNVRNAITYKRLWAHFKKTRKKKKAVKFSLHSELSAIVE